MRRWLPRLLALLAGLLLLGLGCAWYLGSNLDLVALEAQLALAARERTGHDLQLEGLELRLLPLPTVGVSGLTLGAAPGFGPEPLLTVGRARARLRLLPLLRGELELGALVFEEPVLRLERSETGRGSWETLVEHLRAGQNPEAGRGLPRVGRLVLRDASVVYADPVSGRELGVEGLQLRLGPLGGASPTELRVEADLWSVTPALEAELVLTGRGHAAGARLEVSALQAALDLRGESVPGGVQHLALDAPFTLDLARGQLELESLQLAALGLQVDGALEAREADAGFAVEGRLQAVCPDPRALLRVLGREPALVDPTALSQASLSSAFGWDGALLQLTELHLVVDASTATGAVTITGAHPLAAWFDLGLDQLVLDRYATAPAPGSAKDSDLPRVDAWLEGRVRVGVLVIDGLRLEDLALPVSISPGTLGVDGATARLLGATLEASASAELGASPLRYRLRGRASDLDLARLIEASGSQREMTGRLDLELDLQAAGLERPDLLASLGGGLCVSLRDGEMPLAEREGPGAVRQGEQGWQARLAQERFAKVRERLVARATEKLDAKRPEHLVFARMGACFVVEGGVARSDDVMVDADRLQLEGAGSLDLPGEALDFSCVLALDGLPPMDLRVHGSMDDPQVELDKPGAMDIARHRVQQRRGELQGQAEAKRTQLQEELGERRQELRDELRGRSGEGVDRLLDHREQVIERRDDLRDQVQQARQGLRDQLREGRETLQGGRKRRAEPGVVEPEEPNLEPEQGEALP